jgi:hypothetical protein
VIYDAEIKKVSICRPMSLTERLVERKERLERDLNEVNIALEATTRNKEVFEALNSVARVFGDRIH